MFVADAIIEANAFIFFLAKMGISYEMKQLNPKYYQLFQSILY